MPEPTTDPAPQLPGSIAVDKTLLQQYGLPTALLFAILGPLFGAFMWVVNGELKDLRAQRSADRAEVVAKVESLANEVDFMSRMIDLSCQPSKPAKPPP